MRKPFKSQNAAVTAAFFIAPLLPSIFIPLVGPWRFPPDVMGALVVYLIALPFVFAFGCRGRSGQPRGSHFGPWFATGKSQRIRAARSENAEGDSESRL
jgi:hypothetical protein